MLSLLLKNTKVTPHKLYHIIHDDPTNPVSADLHCDLDLHLKQLNSGATSFFQWLKGNLDKVNIHYINCEIHSKNKLRSCAVPVLIFAQKMSNLKKEQTH